MLDLITSNITLILAVIIAVAVTMYVLLDGFDLGIGILYLFAANDAHRKRMINSIAPIWDGNETWLVLGGGGMLAAFPVAYSVILPAVYMPIMIMLLALVFRGIAFEFHAKSEKHKYLWDYSFSLGSIVATFCQGIVLGTFIQGIQVTGETYATYRFMGGHFDWVTSFTMICGFALIIGYALLGACWVVKKTDGPLQKWAASIGKMMLIGVGVFLAIVSILTPLQEPEIARRWFGEGQFLSLFPIPLMTLYCFFRCWNSFSNTLKGVGRDYTPYLYTATIFLLSFIGLGVSFWPYIVPYKITIWDAAAAANSQLLILIGIVMVLPIILIYTSFVYKVFWAKTEEEGYH
jgi:cytochrome d ubiquinol oxidase subunit II